MVFKGHTSMVRAISLEPGGQFLASGSDDGTVKSELFFVSQCDENVDTMI